VVSLKLTESYEKNLFFYTSQQQHKRSQQTVDTKVPAMHGQQIQQITAEPITRASTAMM